MTGRASDVAESLSVAPLAALVGLAIAAFTEGQNHSWWRGPAFVASLAATAGWQAWVSVARPMAPRVLVPLLAITTLVLFVDALSDEETRPEESSPSVA
jgi:hypothetical protein